MSYRNGGLIMKKRREKREIINEKGRMMKDDGKTKSERVKQRKTGELKRQKGCSRIGGWEGGGPLSGTKYRSLIFSKYIICEDCARECG